MKTNLLGRRVRGLSFAALLAADPALASDTDRLRALRIERADTPTVDGMLDDPAWRRAPAHEVFHKHLPRDGEAVPEGLKTRVQLVVEDDALVFGIRAWDPDPARLRGLLARRDKVDVDQDFVGIWIDPAGHGRAAQFVRVNIAGVVSDGMHRADNDESDLGPDFPIDAAVRLLPDGYSMEVRWPLSSLRFPYADGRNWRVMVERSIPHADGTLVATAPFRIDALSRLNFLQEVEGMDATVAAVRDRGFIELRPELTVRRERAAAPGQRARGQQAALGLDINLRPRADWVLNATLNPDYSQVEIDVPTSQGAGNIALSLPEKRGFFLESADVLGLPLPAFYSRTVNDPEYGLRATWRGADMDATAMSLRDEPGGLVLRGRPYETLETIQTGRTVASLARARWHGEGLLLGAFASQRDYHRFGSNDVLGLDAQWQGEGSDGVQHQLSGVAMASRTTAGFGADDLPARVAGRSGAYLWSKYLHKTERWWHQVELEAIAPGFVNDNGFVPQAGIARVSGSLNRILGAQSLGRLELYEFETYLGFHEMRTLSDSAAAQRGGAARRRNRRAQAAPRRVDGGALADRLLGRARLRPPARRPGRTAARHARRQLRGRDHAGAVDLEDRARSGARTPARLRRRPRRAGRPGDPGRRRAPAAAGPSGLVAGTRPAPEPDLDPGPPGQAGVFRYRLALARHRALQPARLAAAAGPEYLGRAARRWRDPAGGMERAPGAPLAAVPLPVAPRAHAVARPRRRQAAAGGRGQPVADLQAAVGSVSGAGALSSAPL